MIRRGRTISEILRSRNETRANPRGSAERALLQVEVKFQRFYRVILDNTVWESM